MTLTNKSAAETTTNRQVGSGIRLRGTTASSSSSSADSGMLPHFNTNNNNNQGENSYKNRKWSGRKKLSKQWFSKYVLGSQQRRFIMHQMQRKPKLAWTYTLAMGSTFVLALLICLGLAFFLYTQLDKNNSIIYIPEQALLVKRAAEIIFRDRVVVVSMNHVLLPLREIEDKKNALEIPDFGGLKLDFVEEDITAERNIIYHDYDLDVTKSRPPDAKLDDDRDGYYDYDDDYERGLYTAYNSHNSIDTNKVCRRISEHRLNLQNCNNVHELGFLESGFTYLGKGAYRQVFSLEHSYLNTVEQLVIKDLHHNEDMSYDMFEFVRMDAIVAELTTSSPRTFDIYGFCGIGILSEVFLHGDAKHLIIPEGGYMKTKDLHDEDGVKPHNKLTAQQKLVIALEMAEGLAVLHGYKNGLIVHDDVKLSQYLFNADFSMLKLNDFNRAEFPLWDEKNQEYCRYKNGHGHGRWRSPEEYKNQPLTEKIDVWSIGNNMYALLTGLNPLYHIKGVKLFTKKIKSKETAFIDPRYRTRSKEERKLVEIIEQCFKHDPKDRPSIFEVVDFLKQAVAECVGKGTYVTEVLQQIATIPKHHQEHHAINL